MSLNVGTSQFAPMVGIQNRYVRETGGDNAEGTSFDTSIQVPYFVDPLNVPASTNISEQMWKGAISSAADFKKQSLESGPAVPEDFRDMGSSLRQTFQVSWLSDRAVCFTTDTQGMNAGAAHPWHSMGSMAYDRQTGTQVQAQDLFKGNSDWTNVLSKYTIDALKLGDDLMFKEGAAPKAENFQIFTPEPWGLKFEFPEYQVGPYAAGPQEVTVPWSTLEPIMKPNGPFADVVAASKMQV